MEVLTAAVILVGALCLIDLMLSFAIIRLLRQQLEEILGEHRLSEILGQHRPSEILGQHRVRAVPGQQADPAQTTTLPLGSKPASFTATSTAGEPVVGPAGVRVVAFFSSTCAACTDKVPEFIEYLRSSHVPRDTVLALLETNGEAVPYYDTLAEVAMVCTQSAGGDLEAAFGVSAYPTFCLLAEDGALTTASHDPSVLRGLVPA